MGRPQTTDHHAITASRLTKVYGETYAVSELDLAVPDGSIYGFLGPNGAGKTTTMRLLTGLVTPTSGTAVVAGASISQPNELVRRIGYAPADPPLYELLTGREQLTYAARFRNMNSDAAGDRIETLLDRFDLLDAADERIETYSDGMKRKVAVLQAVLHDPAVLILDEPTSGLDPQSVRELRSLLRERAAHGRTVFLSTHDLSVVNDIADVIGILDDGRLLTERTPAELKADTGTEEDQSLEEAFIEITRSSAGD